MTLQTSIIPKLIVPSTPPTTTQVGVDDYDDSTSTTGVLAVGGFVTGTIEMSDDEDWFALEMAAGERVELSLTGNTLEDPVLYIYNSNGLFVTGNDDSNGFDSFVLFTATTAGTYYVGANGYGTDTGTYTLSAAEPSSIVAPAQEGPILSALSWGSQLSSNDITVYFGTAGFSADGFISEGFNAYEIGQFQAAFAAIEAVTNLNFSIVTAPTNATFQLVLDTNESNGNFLGYFNPPGESSSGIGVFDGGLWDRGSGGDLSVGGFAFVTIVHELLHGLGMSHPHDTGGGSTVIPGVSAAFDDYGDNSLNQGVFTTMSYNSGYMTGPDGTAPIGNIGSTSGFKAGPMALDIAVLQSFYGANTSTNTGDNSYVLPTGQGTGSYWSSLWDTGGTDAIRHTGSGAAVIDLRAATLLAEEGGGGFVSFADNTPGGFTIANGVVIEEAYGGNANDALTGNDAANLLVGNGGFDTIWGGAENDTIDGGAGADSLYGGSGDDMLIGAAGFDQLHGEAGNDTLVSGTTADRLFGGDDDDVLYGGGNFGITVDGLWGEDGNDTLYGEGGFDLLDGGEGNDYLDGGHQADNIYGRDGNDTMIGDLGLDRLFGGNDDDIGYGGDGNDGLFGQHGNDTLYGEAGNDRFFGGPGNDLMDGGIGNDSIFAGAGFDTLIGGAGDDLLQGDFNADTFVFADGHGNDTITDFASNNAFENINLSGVSAITNLTDLMNNHLSQSGNNVIIDTGDDQQITLLGVDRADLDSTDFLF